MKAHVPWLSALYLAFFPVAGAEEERVPAWTEAQIEEDWLIQARMSPENLRALARLDAARIIDGVKSGQPEQQTLLERWAWWEVDLGAEIPLDRIEILNPRPNRDKGVAFKVSIGATREEHRQVHFMRGPEWTNSHLVVTMAGRPARWLRVWAGEWRDRMRLSEVEVYGASNQTNNLARLGRANQSSFQMHSGFRLPDKVEPESSHTAKETGQRAATAGRKKRRRRRGFGPKDYPLVRVPVAETIARGRKLATALADQGVATGSALAALAGAERRLAATRPGCPPAELLPLYVRARRTIRELAFANPLLRACDRLFFIKRAPGWKTSASLQFNSRLVRPGGGICLMEGLSSGKPTVRCLTGGFPAGNFAGLDVSRDARRLLFAHARHEPGSAKAGFDKPARTEESFYQLYEMDLESGRSRRLTEGRYDDFHGVYLPDGDIAFMSTRRASFIQLGYASAQATRTNTFRDCHLRCGASEIHTLHRMSPDGSMLQTLSPTETHEWFPAVAHDGRLLYARWDYVDRDARIAFSLWSSNPDGTQPAIVYGNYTRQPYSVFEVQPIPDSHRLVFTGSAHHGNAGGPLMILDPYLGVDGPDPLTNLTPEVGMPEYDVFPLTYYQAPWPLSEDFFLCAWSPRPLTISNALRGSAPNDLGMYLYDRFGNRELLHRDPAINATTPIPWRPRPVPPQRVRLPVVTDKAPAGRFVLSAVYTGMTGIPRGTVKRLRIVAVPPKVYGKRIPACRMKYYEPGKFVLGTVPVERDGSAHFVAPAGVPLWFQALAEDGRAVQTMRSVTYLQGGETASCIGCHERRNLAPPSTPPLAARRQPSKIRPDVDGSWPLRFDRLVQPVLDRLVGLDDPKVADLDLAPARDWKQPGLGRGSAETYGWMRLVAYGGNEGLLAVGRRQDVDTGFAPSVPGQCLATGAPLWELLTAAKGSPLTRDERARLTLWMDVYIPFVGHFTEEQERDIVALRERWASLLEQKPRR